VVITAEKSEIAYEVTLRAPTDVPTLLGYYTQELRQYSAVTALLSKRSAKIALPDFRTVVIYVYVIPLSVTESIVVLHVGSNTDEPITTFVGVPSTLFPTVSRPFATHMPLAAPSNTTVIVERAEDPQPPVYRGSRQVRFEEAYPMRIVTYDVPASAAAVQQFYDQQLRLDNWTYEIESANAFDNYTVFQGKSKPTFSMNTFIIPVAPDRTIVNVVMYISGPGNWRDMPPPPTPEP
jgi:hypothetical protein